MAAWRGLERVVEVDDDQAGRGGDIGVMAAERDVAGAGEHAALVPGHGALEEIVARLAVGEGVDVDQDQAFLGVGDDGVAVERVEGLLLIFGMVAADRLVAADADRLVGRQAPCRSRCCVPTCVSWPSGEKGAVTIRSDTPLLPTLAMS